MVTKVLFVLSVLWCYAHSQCTTPLGQTSQCVSLYDCPPLLSAFEQRPLPSYVVSHLRKAQCGFEGYVPRVCCGPLPAQTQTTSRPRPRPTRPSQPNYNGQAAPSNREDSVPSPRGQCGEDTNGDRIYGGEFTDLDEFPWMALMGYLTSRNTYSYQCGGVLVNRRYVITAAHCVTGAIEQAVGTLKTVRLGEYNTETEEDCIDGTCADAVQEIPVQLAVPHPDYVDGTKHRIGDIAVVRLAQRARLSYYVKPICLSSNTRMEAGTDVHVAGWGKTLSGKSSPIKLKLTLPIFDKKKCADKFRALGAQLGDKQLCAGGVFSQDTCRGDSGGPLMKREPDGTWYSVGVVSFGYDCGRDGWPGVYTSIAGYIDWIQSTIRNTNN